ncbi:MAG TPA: hypothetical protein VJ721_05215 [Chthoniobacterales bacterium]|nr:hypothetical protein [Chthoniobacterales bacterium]
MKPVAQKPNRQGDRDFSPTGCFPLIEFNYQSFSLDRFNGGGSGNKPRASFFDISRDYFQREARRNFLGEVAFFLVFTAVLVGSVIEVARLIIHFLQLLSA